MNPLVKQSEQGIDSLVRESIYYDVQAVGKGLKISSTKKIKAICTIRRKDK